MMMKCFTTTVPTHVSTRRQQTCLQLLLCQKCHRTATCKSFLTHTNKLRKNGIHYIMLFELFYVAVHK